MSDGLSLKESYPYYLANEARAPNADLVVFDKYTGRVATRVALADVGAIEEGIAASVQAFDELRRWPSYRRQDVLNHCVRRFEERFDELAYGLCVEAGKPIKDARGEVTRLIDTFRYGAEESVRLTGEVMDLQISARAAGRSGYWKRFPVGPCSFISPFNFPLNLVAHKVAAALAVGCSFVLKPASRTPVGAILIGEILAETDLPKGTFSILPCPRGGAADLFVTDDRLKLLSFTGSPAAGWDMKARCGRKKIVLELGGNAACVVDEGTDLADATERIVIGAFYQSGQSCIGVQRILVHDSIYDELKARLVAATEELVAGDPKDPATFVGPMISESEAVRVESWIRAAVAEGAKVLCGGQRNGAVLAATLLESVPRHCDLYAQEAFGPVACLGRFSDFDDALAEVNDSRYGLQAGIFTRDIYKIEKAWAELQVGGVVIGDVPSWRVDHMPYGGVKDSGLGREGLRYAMEDMTEIRLLVVRTPPGV